VIAESNFRAVNRLELRHCNLLIPRGKLHQFPNQLSQSHHKTLVFRHVIELLFTGGDLVRFDAESPVNMTTTPERAFSEVRFLTVAEVASVMRVSKMTVYRLVHGGDLPAVRVGRSFRVPEQAVHDYLRDSFIETA
jgi:excisionase family DNA binding protein